MKCPKCQTENPEESKFCRECAFPLTAPSEPHPSFTRTLETPVDELTTGITFADRYQIIEELGKGGMGSVYKVLDKEIDTKVALKLVKPEIAADKNNIERFRNELKVAREISHKNVCRMYDLNKIEGSYFITMEYVEGQDLKSLIRQTGKLAASTALSIAIQTGEGLEEAHRLGVVHRDLKPSNIMIDREGNARIMDFGIARSLKAKGITGAGVMIGTPEYMSPEQVEAKDVDRRSDIYSLGVILFEMVTGQLPFAGETPLSIAVKHKSEIPKRPIEVNPEIPEDLNRLILRCLEKDRGDRYQSAQQLVEELKNIQRGIPTTQREIPFKKRTTAKEVTVTMPVKKLSLSVAAVAVLVIAAIFVTRQTKKKEAVTVPKIENSIAVISFANQTGDPSLSYLQEAIPNLLITDLEQSGNFYVATWERLFDLLGQVGKEDVEIIDSDLGFDLCRLEGIEAIVIGSFIKAGDVFATDVKVLDVESRRILTSASSKGEGIDSILNLQIDELSAAISEGLKMASDKDRDEGLRIADVSTNSMEAYRYYLEGIKQHRRLFQAYAIDNLKKALEIDPSFAMAHYYLAAVYTQLQNTESTREALKKALAFASKATEKEALYINAAYALRVEGDLNKSVAISEEIVEKFPKEKEAHYLLGSRYRTLGRTQEAIAAYNKALALDPNWGSIQNALGYLYISNSDFGSAEKAFQKYAALTPGDPNAFDSLGEMFFMMGRLDDAAQSFQSAVDMARKQNEFWLTGDVNLAYIYALKEDYPAALRQFEFYAQRRLMPEYKLAKLWHMTRLYLHLGRYRDALNLSQEGIAAAGTMVEDQKALAHELLSFVYAEKGDLNRAEKELQTCLEIRLKAAPGNNLIWRGAYLCLSAYFDLKYGEAGSAEGKLRDARKILPQLESRFRIIYGYWCDLLEGEILLARGQLQKAIAAFRNISPPAPDYVHWYRLYSYRLPVARDGLARALYAAGEIDQAIAEYRRLTTFDPGSRDRFLIDPRFYYRLGKLYEEKRSTESALQEYEKFLDFWQGADPGLAELEDARQRVVSLKR